MPVDVEMMLAPNDRNATLFGAGRRYLAAFSMPSASSHQ